MFAQSAEVEELVDAPQQMVGWDVLFQVEGIEELILVRRVTHHGLHLRQGETAGKPQARQLKNQCFSTELVGSCRPDQCCRASVLNLVRTSVAIK
jgi:hypothetical protein